MLLADYVFRFLADRGVEEVFMVSGGGAMFLNDALGREKRLNYRCFHHEQAAAIAAEGYARVTGKPAVVSVTTGPGGTNALTGVLGEWLDSQPAIYISGQVKYPTTIAYQPEISLRQLGDQEINIIDIIKPVTKYAAVVTDPSRIRHELEKAFYHAVTGRKGPVWLDIPIDVQSAGIEPNALDGFIPDMDFPELDHASSEALFRLFCAAEKPVVIAGHGIRLANAQDEFIELAGKLNVPVLMTFNGLDVLPSDRPCNIGRVGTAGTRAGNIALQNADFVLCIGTRNNIRQISYNWENFAKNAKTLAVVDIDAAELSKHTVKADVKIHADAGDFIRHWLTLADGAPEWREWLEWNQARREKYPIAPPEYAGMEKGVQPYYFMEKVTGLLPENAILASANGTPCITLLQAGRARRGQRLFSNSGCATMGYGLPAALGALFAAGNTRQVVCLEGDGSLMMNVQELQTAKHYNLPVKLFLFGNNEYCSIRQTQDNFFDGRRTGCTPESGVSFPDWEKLAEAFGWRYVKITRHAGMEGKIAEVLSMDGAVFCELELVPGYTFTPKLSSRKLPDGTLVSSSLEDMYPFLPEDEMKDNVFHGKF